MDYNGMAMSQMASGNLGGYGGAGGYGGISPYSGMGGSAQFTPYQGLLVSGNPNQGATNTYVTNSTSTSNYTAPSVQLPAGQSGGTLNYAPTFNTPAPAQPPQPEKPQQPSGAAPSQAPGPSALTWHNPNGSLIQNTGSLDFLRLGMIPNNITRPTTGGASLGMGGLGGVGGVGGYMGGMGSLPR